MPGESIEMPYSLPSLLLRLQANVSIRQHVTWLGKQVSRFCSNTDKTKPKQTTSCLHPQFLPSGESQVCICPWGQQCKKEGIFIIHQISSPQKLVAQVSASPRSFPGRGCPISLWDLCGVLWNWLTKLISPAVIYKSQEAQQNTTKLGTLLDWRLWQTRRTANTKPVWGFCVLPSRSAGSSYLMRQSFSLTIAKRKNRIQA